MLVKGQFIRLPDCCCHLNLGSAYEGKAAELIESSELLQKLCKKHLIACKK